MNSGEIRQVDFGSPDGHSQAGVRPGLIIQNNRTSALLRTCLVVSLTSTQSTLRFPGTFILPPSAVNGLTAPSVVLTFQLRAVDQRRLLKRLGHVDRAILDDVFDKLNDVIR